MLKNRRMRDLAGLPSFCYADGKRSGASQNSCIDIEFDSGIRAVVIDLDVSYDEARRFIELEIPSATVKSEGVPRGWMAKFLEYAGYIKAPQPTSTLSLRNVLSMLGTDHRVMLEINDSRYVPLVDSVLYDVKDWRDDMSYQITGYWVFRQRRIVWSGTLTGRVSDASGCIVETFEDSDVLVRDPVELAGYAFHTRRFDNAWEPDESGSCNFEATFAVTLQHSQEPLLIHAQSMRCSPKYLRAFDDETSAVRDSAVRKQQMAKHAMTDARRLLDACDLDYELKGNGTLRLGNALGYRPQTGEVFSARERRVKVARGFKTLLRTL